MYEPVEAVRHMTDTATCVSDTCPEHGAQRDRFADAHRLLRDNLQSLRCPSHVRSDRLSHPTYCPWSPRPMAKTLSVQALWSKAHARTGSVTQSSSWTATIRPTTRSLTILACCRCRAPTASPLAVRLPVQKLRLTLATVLRLQTKPDVTPATGCQGCAPV